MLGHVALVAKPMNNQRLTVIGVMRFTKWIATAFASLSLQLAVADRAIDRLNCTHAIAMVSAIALIVASYLVAVCASVSLELLRLAEATLIVQAIRLCAI